MLFVRMPGKYALGHMNPVMRSQALLAAAHAGRLLLSLVTAGVLGRNLAPGDFGFVALLSSVYVVAVEVLDMGTTAVATREIAAQPAKERETLEALLALRRLVSTAAFAALLGLACSDYVAQREQRGVLAFAACGVFLLHLHSYQLVFQVRQAYGRRIGCTSMRYEAIRSPIGGSFCHSFGSVQVIGGSFLSSKRIVFTSDSNIGAFSFTCASGPDR